MPNRKISTDPGGRKGALDVLGPKKQQRASVLHQKLGKFRTAWQAHALGQLLFAENGALHLNVEGRKMLVPPWYCVWIPPGLQHEVWSDHADLFIRCLNFNSKECLHEFFHTLSTFHVSDLLKGMIVHTERWNDRKEENIYESTFLKAIQQMLPEEMLASVQIHLPSTHHEKLQQVTAFIHMHLSEQITIEMICARFNISMRTLQRLFQDHLSISFSSYLKIARILRAVELLTHGNMNVSQVAFEVGYESLPTFSNTFYGITGNRPNFFSKSRENDQGH